MNKEKIGLRRAFPPFLCEDLQAVLKILPAYKMSGEYFTVNMYGGTLRIPERIYCEEVQSDIMGSLTEQQRKIAFCLYTRHYDGYVRERHLREIVKMRTFEKWLLPYVLRLSGEYVVEILEVVHDHLNEINHRIVAGFVLENPTFCMRLKSRVASYWDCYYRDRYPDKEKYAGFLIIKKIEDFLK
ncbi:MAG: hypothetical protein ACI35R_12620 [Bacillus sp. (in: firmicutes)]